LHLLKAGFSDKEFIGPLNQLQAIFYRTQTECSVDYAGPLAGHRCGLYRTRAGGRVLVTSEPNLEVFEVPKSDKITLPQHWDRFLSELFSPDPEQIPYVMAWLKCARESLLQQDWRPGQTLVLAGPSGSGKSFFQHLITEFLGGRGADPYRYMMGLTSFNADLSKAEHLLIEDRAASTDIRTRRRFGTMIKEFTVCMEMSIHPKGREAVVLPVYHRLTISVNDEAENVMLIPPLDDSLLDKLSLFRCGYAQLSEDRKENWDNLTKEIPMLAAWLHRWRVPKNMVDPRYGVRAYQNRTLFDLLSELSPEQRLANLIDEVLFVKEIGPWTGTAEQLEQTLYRSAFSFQVEKLLHFSSACGVYLARLALKWPSRFEARKTGDHKTRWIIRAPEKKSPKAEV
jgi:hypothetical protein